MLNNLTIFGVNNAYFKIKRIGDFDNSTSQGISHINTQAIEFDKTKQKICDELKHTYCKSCDALDIIHTKNQLNFIEFKQIDDSNLQDYIQKLDLPQKLKDSHFILLNIIRKNQFKHDKKISLFKACKKNCIIVYGLNTNSTLKIGIYLRHLTVKSIIQQQFKDSHISGENFEDPIFMQLSNFDLKYQQYT